MASTYVNDLRLEEIGTGEQSGTWGDTTNTNLELIAEAFSFGTEAITTNADTHTTTIADGATDPGRSMFLKYTGTLDSACTITIGPNTVSKLWFIENGTSGSQNIIISQGSGANITIPPGDTKAIYSDGAGSGAAMVDAFASLNVGSFTSEGASTITTADNLAQLTLTSTDADASSGPQMSLYRNSSSPADNDFIGRIQMIGRNDNSQDFVGVDMIGRIKDASDGTEDSEFRLATIIDGTASTVFKITPTQIIFNEDNADLDFLVESDTKPNAFSLNGATGSVGFNVLDGDVTGDATAARQYVSIIGTANRGRLNIGSTASNGADAGTLAFTNGANTLVSFSVDTTSGVQNTGTLNVLGTRSIKIQAAATDEVVFNESGLDVDFRVESDDNTNMLYVDAANDGVAIGTATVDGGPLTVQTGNTHPTAATFQSTGTTQLFLKDTDAATDNKYWGFQVSGGSLNIITCDDDKAGGFVTPLEFNQTDIKIGTGADLITNTASGTTNTRIGTNAGDSIVASNAGLNNVLIGVNAGTALDSGDSNIAIGYHALKTEDDHANNIAIGAMALENQDAGADGYNVAVGYNAGNDITDGIRNVIIGGIAGDQATTIDDCVIIGYNAGGNATMTGHDNVLIGKDAGQELTSGYLNVMVGLDAGTASTDAFQNTFIGENAGFTNIGGDTNTFVGSDAGYLNEGGNGNTYIGKNAGESMTSGSENTFLGSYNGNQNNLDIRTSSNQIVLSDGQGNIKFHHDGGNQWYVSNQTAASYWPAASSSNGQNAVMLGTNSGILATTTNDAVYFNKNNGDGAIVLFYSAGGNEGSISISGSTTSFNGGHLSRWSQFTDGSKDTSLLKGTVMTNLDQMAVWKHVSVAEGDKIKNAQGETIIATADDVADAYTEDNEQLNCMAVSSVEGDANVAGVFVNWDAQDDGYNDMNIAMTGDMIIRIAKGVTIARGDLLMSAGDGTAKPQDDDIVRSKTIAKVTSTQVSNTYDDGTYCVPCVLMAC